MTIVYLMRHSEPFKPTYIEKESLQVQNEKWILSKQGEELAKKVSEKESWDFDIVYSSHYVRAISTAKYFSNKEIFIEKAFGERKFGIKEWQQLPSNFEKKQWENRKYKMLDGECLQEVQEREIKALTKILHENKNKKVLIVGHATALMALLSTWCEVDEKGNIYFKGKKVKQGLWDYCEMIKLIFNENNELIEISQMKS